MEKYSFFNSISGDRVYQAEDFAAYFENILSNGIFPVPSNTLQVIQKAGMEVIVQPGAAFISGYLYQNTEQKTLTVSLADAALHRKDLVVVRLDHGSRTMETLIKQGAPSASGVVPTVTRNDSVYELALAEIHIAAGAGSITTNQLIDTRLDNTRCGVVNSLIKADTTSIFREYEHWLTEKTGEFETNWNEWLQNQQNNTQNAADTFRQEWETWFENVQIDTANHTHPELQNQLDEQAKKGTQWHNVISYGARTDLENNSPAFQAALDAAERQGGGTVFVPAGLWNLQETIQLPSHVTLRADEQAIMKRNAPIYLLFRNKTDGVTGGYGQAEKIRVYGGILDGSKDLFEGANCGLMLIGHAKHIHIEGVTFRNLHQWHMIELNAVQHATIRNCLFTDHTGTGGAESVQLDMSQAGHVELFPFMAPADVTPCEYITLEGNRFVDVLDGFGSHFAPAAGEVGAGNHHKHITVRGNHFINLGGTAVKAYQHHFLLVDGNHFRNCYNGIIARTGTQSIFQVTITNNTLHQIGTQAGDLNGRAIQIQGSVGTGTDGITGAFRYRQVTVTGNNIRAAERYGIDVAFADNFNISDNIINSTGFSGILCLASRYGHVRGNNVSTHGIKSAESPAVYSYGIVVGYPENALA